MTNNNFAKNISYWPISDDEWLSLLINDAINLSDHFDNETLALFINYGIFENKLEQNYNPSFKLISENKKLNTLSLIVSEGCNFKCPHCIHANDVKSLSIRKLNTYMDLNTVKESIDLFFSHARSIDQYEINVDFGAAEPIINWAAIDCAVNYIKDNYSIFSVTYHMTTNLSLVTEYQTKFFIDNKFKISTSLDGNKLANDIVRIDTKGKGTYDLIIKKIEAMREIGYSFDSTNLTLTKDNISVINVEEYLDTVQSMGFNGIGLDFDVVTSENLSVDYVCDKMLEIYDACKRRGLYCVGTWLHPAENMLDPELSENNAFCKAVKGNNISVSPQGTLHMCNFTSTHLGNLTSFPSYGNNLNSLLNERELFVKNHCNECDLQSACGGQCHATLEVDPLIRNKKIEFMCDFYRKLTKEVVIRAFQHQLSNEQNT